MPVLVEWIIAGTVVFVVLGRALFGRWFNHFSLIVAAAIRLFVDNPQRS